MNKNKAAYARQLEERQRAGEIVRYRFEPIKFRLADLAFYMPDVEVQLPDEPVMKTDARDIEIQWREAVHLKRQRKLGYCRLPEQMCQIA